MKIFTYIIIAVTSLAVAGMSFAKPMSKRTGPLKQKSQLKVRTGYEASEKFVNMVKGKKVPKPPTPYRGMSHPRAHRLFKDS